MSEKNWDTPLREAIYSVLAEYGAQVSSSTLKFHERVGLTKQATDEVMDRIWDWMTDGSEASLPPIGKEV